MVSFLRSQDSMAGLLPLPGRPSSSRSTLAGIRGSETIEALSGVCAREGDAKGAGMCLPMFSDVTRARRKVRARELFAACHLPSPLLTSDIAFLRHQGLVLLTHCLEATRDNYSKGEKGRWEGREEEDVLWQILGWLRKVEEVRANTTGVCEKL